MTDPLNVLISVDELGRGSLNINGLELGPHVKAIRLDAGVKELTTLTVKLIRLRVHAEAEVDPSEAKPSWAEEEEPDDEPTATAPVAPTGDFGDWPEGLRGGGGHGYCDHDACFAVPNHAGPHRGVFGAALTDEELTEPEVKDIPF